MSQFIETTNILQNNITSEQTEPVITSEQTEQVITNILQDNPTKESNIITTEHDDDPVTEIGTPPKCKCIIGISNNKDNVYDNSEPDENEKTFYTHINYMQLNSLYEYLSASFEDKVIKPLTDIKLLCILDFIKKSEDEIDIYFKFICSGDCVSGNLFLDDSQSQMVCQFIKTITSIRKVIIDSAIEYFYPSEIKMLISG